MFNELHELAVKSGFPNRPGQIRSLADLDLEPGDWEILATQGFITAEHRNGNAPYYKLRFRRGGKQVVRYLGGSPDVIATIRRELAILQRNHRQSRRLAQRQAAARRLLRHYKDFLTPLLETAGFHYHGQAIRRRRARSE